MSGFGFAFNSPRNKTIQKQEAITINIDEYNQLLSNQIHYDSPKTEKFNLYKNSCYKNNEKSSENASLSKNGGKSVDFKMSRQWCKIKATLWKCYIVRTRHYVQTAFTIIIPLILFLLVAYARSKVTSLGKHQVNETTYNPIYQDAVIYNRYKFDVGNTALVFAPKNAFTKDLIREVQIKLDLHNHVIRGFETEDDLLLFYNNNPPEGALYALIFKELSGNDIPKKLNYDVRSYDKFLDWQTNELFISNIVSNYIPGIGSETYFNKGFIVLQLAINEVFLKMQLQEKSGQVSFAMQEFPYPPHTEDTGLSDLFMHLLPFVTLFSFLLICPSTLKRIVEEKDSGIKELMKMMGLPPTTMWICWFIDAIVLNLISIIIIVVLLKFGLGNGNVVIEYSNGIILFLFFFFYCSACIALCFVISTLMDSPNLTTTFGIIFWMVTYLIPYSFSESMNIFGFYEKGFLCILIPNIAMYYGFRSISLYEARGIGINWTNLFTSASGGENDISLGHTFIFFIISLVFLLLLTLYLDSVRPGKYGLPKSWTFPIAYLSSCCTKYSKKRRGSVTDASCAINIETYTKVEPCSLEPGIEIDKLRKNYGAHTAVNDLNINFYKGEITVLLGHNGAGKTTTMSILTGMIKASRGKVTIANYDIKESLDYIRSLIGICPQHNLLFPDLTAKEHLQFFAKLNDIENYNRKINDLLDKLKLTHQKNSLPNNLSGGMKRKLCLGMAIISDPVVLILDEPTSGLDPKSRREIWDILLDWRKEEACSKRTVLISTHFMEEAEVLGNRIAIMDHGNLIAYGTPMFLKKEYSTGYILTLFKKDNRGSKGSNKELDSKINSMVNEVIEKAILKINVDNTLTYSLPHESKDKFSRLLKEIEANKEELGIDNYNVSITTLEDIFLKISNLVNNETGTDEIEDTSTYDAPGSTISNSSKKPLMGFILFKNHFQVLKSLYVSYLLYVLVSLTIILITLLLATPTSFNFLRKKQEFTMNLGNYGPSTVFYSGPQDVQLVQNIMQNFESVVKGQTGNPRHVPSVSEALVNMGIKNIEEYKQHAIIAAEFNKTKGSDVMVNMMYSNLALHGAPIAINLAFDTVLKTFLGNEFGISASNVPLPATKAFDSKQQSEVQVALLWMLLFPMAMLFLMGSFIIYPYKERSSNMKKLVFMTGVRSLCYWFFMFIFDMIIYLCYVVIIIFLIFVFSNITDTFFQGINEYGAITLLLLAYGASTIPYSYLFSYKKTIPSAFGTFVMVNLFTGVVLTVIIIVLQNSGDEYYENLGDKLHYLFQILPQYWLTYNIVAFTRKAVFNYNWDIMDPLKKVSVCRFNENPCCPINGIINTKSCEEFQSYFTEGLKFLHVVGFAFITFLIFGAFLLVVDSVFIKKLHPSKFKRYFNRSNSNDNKPYLDEQRSDSDETSSDSSDDRPFYEVKHLSKEFGNRTVVDDLGFGVVEGKCFGLLGVNGAGKTTTFRMLTGDECPDSGSATINRKSNLEKNREDYLSKIGYCPQFNAINEILSPNQLLTLFAELRNVEDVDSEVRKWIERLGLSDYENIPSGNLSGGNKRKLCLGISLIGHCSVIMLDEPTSGVDPLARRKLWNVLKNVKNQNKKSIILTSHSMDECEMLCDDLAIMKEGKFQCKDKIHNLKDTYGKGYTVLIRLNKSRDEVDGVCQTDTISQQVRTVFEDTFKKLNLQPVLKDEHESLLHYYIPNPLKMSEMFEEMENFKQKVNNQVEDYFINKASLEDVFLSFSNDSEDKKQV